MRSFEPVRNERGIALVIALIMLLVLTLIGVAAVSMSSYETSIAGNERLYNLAFYASDGAIENFRGRVTGGEFIYSGINTGSYQVTIGESLCDVTYTRRKRSDAGGDYSVFFVRTEGRAPFPAQGRVIIEANVEASMMKPEGYN